VLERAEALARASIARDPKRPEAYVYLAASLGYQGRILGLVRARLNRFPEQAKEALDTSLKNAPNDPWSLAAMGGWNVEVVRNGGSFLANMLYGAKADVGIALFRKAIAVDPGNLVLHQQFAISLSGYDLEGHENDIRTALNAALRAKPRTEYERTIQGRAGALLALLDKNAIPEYRALVRRYQGYA